MTQSLPVYPMRIWRDTAFVLGNSASTGNTMTWTWTTARSGLVGAWAF